MLRSVASLALFTLATPALAQTFVSDTISGTPGFGSVLDSGPAKFSTANIDADLAALEADAADMSCGTTQWAGTWVRGRSPRLQGETEGGDTVMGSSITNGTVDGSPFSAALASGGLFMGETDEGTELWGHFARLGSKRAIWYGVEVDCGASEPEPLVLNGDFQQEPASTPINCGGVCEFWPSDLPEWFTSGSSGAFQPTTAFIAGVTDDEHVAYLNGGASISQTIGTLTSEDAYVVAFTLHTRFDAAPTSFDVELRVGGVSIGWVTGGVSPAVGTSAPFVAAFPKGAVDLSGFTEGVSLVELRITNPGGAQLNIDDVVVTAGSI